MLVRVFAKVLLLIGLFGVLISIWMLLRHPTEHKDVSEKKKIVRVAVIVLKDATHAGTPISSEMLRSLDVDDDKKPKNAFDDTVRNRKSLIGNALGHDVAASAILTTDDLILTSSTSPLASRLAPGHLAFAVKVSSETAAAGLVRPNDLVDLLVSLHFNAASNTASLRYSSIWVLKGVRVIAINSYSSEEQLHSLDTSPDIKTITIDVTPDQAKKISVAESLGEIHVALRSLMDHADHNASNSGLSFMSDDDRTPSYDDDGETIRLQDRFYKADKEHVVQVYSGTQPPKEFSW